MSFHPSTWLEWLFYGLLPLGSAAVGTYAGYVAASNRREAKLADLASIEAERMSYILDRLRDEIALNQDITLSIYKAQRDGHEMYAPSPKNRVWSAVQEEYRALELDQHRRQWIERAYDPIEPLKDALPEKKGGQISTYVPEDAESMTEAREVNRVIKKQANRAKNETLSALQNVDWGVDPEDMEHASAGTRPELC